jgi:hypothetical protein
MVLTPAVKLSKRWTASYKNGKMNTLTELNGHDSKPLRRFSELTFRNSKIVHFKHEEQTVQALGIMRPTASQEATLVKEDSAPSPIRIAKGMKVQDYRICDPVALNDFPDKTCPPKAYVFSGSLPTVEELQGFGSATFAEPVKVAANHAPIFIVIAPVLLLACAAGLIYKQVLLAKR